MALHQEQHRRARRRNRPNPVVVDAKPKVASNVTPPRDRLDELPPPPDVACQLVHDELLLDGNAQLNLTSYHPAEPRAGSRSS